MYSASAGGRCPKDLRGATPPLAGRPGTVASRSIRHSASATVLRTAATASGFTEMDVIPWRTRCSAKAGRFDGACPHSDDVIPASLAPPMMRPMASRTAGSASSKTSAQIWESRSTPSISWVRSLLPMDTPVIPMEA